MSRKNIMERERERGGGVCTQDCEERERGRERGRENKVVSVGGWERAESERSGMWNK
jgi:hypothetical protein